jgi:hypothetical protein
MEHVCKWEQAMDERTVDFIADPNVLGYADLKGHIRQLILDSYHRGHEDGQTGLTLKARLTLENMKNHLRDHADDLADILFIEE